MKYELSDHAAKRLLARQIESRWIEMALTEPDLEEPDRVDSAVRHALKRIAEADNRILRVVYNATTTPSRIISVYFDRRMKGKL